VFDEIIALLGKFERLGTYHFKSGSPIAKIALAPLRIVYQRLRNPKIAQLGCGLCRRRVMLPIQLTNQQFSFIELHEERRPRLDQLVTIVLRANSAPLLVTEELRTKVRELDPSLAVANVRLLDRIVEEQFSTPRFALFLIGLFAALALLLAAIGIYGVISYSVSQRMHEFGMRLALGASSWNLVKMVMKQGVLRTVTGVAIGLGCALAFAGVLDSLLYGVSARDPLTLIGVGTMAVGAATLASLPSARRATGADPMTSLRAE